MIEGMNQTAPARFEAKVDRSGGDDACHLWTAARLKNGYGIFNADGGRQNQYAHRVAWELAHGSPAPKDRQVQHTCDVRACVNPRHLKLGTPADNTRDMMVRGRYKQGESAMAPLPPLRTNGFAWGSERVRLGISMRELSRRTGINRGTLSYLESGRMVPTADEWQRVVAVLRDAERRLSEAAPSPGADLG